MSLSEDQYSSLLKEFLQAETPKRKARLQRMDGAYYLGDFDGKAKNARMTKPAAQKRYVSTNKLKRK